MARIALCFLLCSATAIADPPAKTVIPVVDSSQPGAPIRVSGSTTAKDRPSNVLRYTLGSNISVANISPKPILAFIVQVDIEPPFKIRTSRSVEDDYFFRADSLAPNAVAKFQWTFGPVGEPQGPYESGVEKRTASHARLVWAQFLDGSIWGDRDAAKQLTAKRQLSMIQLENLAKIYRTAGEKEFVKDLSQPTELEPLWTLQRLLRQNSVGSVLGKLDEMLLNAQSRNRGPSGD